MNYLKENSLELRDQAIEALHVKAYKFQATMLQLSFGILGLSVIGILILLS